MKILIASLSLGFAVGSASAASVSWSTSPGLLDTEVSTNGSPVIAYYFNSDAGNPATTLVNGVSFTLNTTGTAPAGLGFNGSFNNAETGDAYQVPLSGGNAGLNQILDGQNWGGAAALSATGLTAGQTYEMQFMVSDDRANFLNSRNYDVSDANDPEGARDIDLAYHSTAGGGVPGAAPAGSVEAKIFTGTFVADGTGQQDVYSWLYEGADHTGGNSGSQINAFQLRLIPEPTTTLLGAFASLALFARRRRS